MKTGYINKIYKDYINGKSWHYIEKKYTLTRRQAISLFNFLSLEYPVDTPKINQATQIEIKERYKKEKITLRKLADEYKVSLNMIWKIVANKS